MDWRRVSRWSLVGAALLAIWMLWPVASCTWTSFVETPLPQVEHQRNGDGDDGDSAPKPGFFASVSDSVSACYAAQPMSSHPDWKRNLLYSLLILAILAALLRRMTTRRRDTGY